MAHILLYILLKHSLVSNHTKRSVDCKTKPRKGDEIIDFNQILSPSLPMSIADYNRLLKESDIMLSKNEVRVRFIICLCLFTLSGSGLVTGWMGAICGVIGTIELATALLRYSPVYDLKNSLNLNVKPQRGLTGKLNNPSFSVPKI